MSRRCPEGPRTWAVGALPGSCPRAPPGAVLPQPPAPAPGLETCVSRRPAEEGQAGRGSSADATLPAIVLSPAQFPHSVPRSLRHKGCGRGRGARGRSAAGGAAGVEAPELPESQGLGPECPKRRRLGRWPMGRVSPVAAGWDRLVAPSHAVPTARGPRWLPPHQRTLVSASTQPWSHPLALGPWTPPPRATLAPGGPDPTPAPLGRAGTEPAWHPHPPTGAAAGHSGLAPAGPRVSSREGGSGSPARLRRCRSPVLGAGAQTSGSPCPPASPEWFSWAPLGPRASAGFCAAPWVLTKA